FRSRRFSTCDGLTLLDVQWGSELSGSRDEDVGLWIRLEKTPALPPWQPPTSWEELWQAIRLSGTHPSALLHLIPKRFRNGLSHTLLIGFPIPRRVLEPPERMHWLAVRLPVLSRGSTQTVDGFRGPEGGWEMRDRRVVFQSSPLQWIGTENWAED